MPTKEAKREARGVIEGLENRVHFGPPVVDTEIQAVREFLRQRDFSPSSDYFSRLVDIQSRLRTRLRTPVIAQAKRNYGGEIGGRFMQVQMVYDHLILSTCYDGEFRTQRGRIKISHRFNQEGRIEFVELKFLNSLHSCLDGQIRKLLMIKDYQAIRKDWHAAEAFVLPALPRELVFLHDDAFRSPKAELFSWLVNIGHGIVDQMLAELRSVPAPSPALRSDRWNGSSTSSIDGSVRWSADTRSNPASNVALAPSPRHATSGNGRKPEQLRLSAVLEDEAASTMLESIAAHESAVEAREDDKTVLVRCRRRTCPRDS
jgi:hypothetical protein